MSTDLPESHEVMTHGFLTKITQIERESLKKFHDENCNRWGRCGEIDEFFTALESHESIGREWLAEWRVRVRSVLEGKPRPTSP